MPALTYNFEIEQGSTFNRSFKWVDAKGIPRLLTNWTALSQWRLGYGQPVILTMSTQNGRIKLVESTISIILDAQVTKDLDLPIIDSKKPPKQTYFYDLWLFSSDNKAIRFMKGVFSVSGVITK
jgi:hypothetical protein